MRYLTTILVFCLAAAAMADQSPSPLGCRHPQGAAAAPPPPLLFLFRDNKAVGLGDVVTVLVTQSAVASEQSHTGSSQTVKVAAQAGSGIFNLLPTAGLSHNGSYDSQAQGSKSVSVVATVGCRVVEMSPSGTMRVEGSQEIIIDKRAQTVQVSGWLRPQDIGANNSILSSQLSDVHVEFKGNWETSTQGKTLLDKIINGFKRLVHALT